MRLLPFALAFSLSLYGCSTSSSKSPGGGDVTSLDDVASLTVDAEVHTDDDGHGEGEDGHEEHGDTHDPDASHAEHLHIDTEWAEAVKTGQNRLKINLRDHDDAPIVGASILVDPQMPIHGHGSSEDPVVTELGDGNYEAFPVTFTMPGPWVVHVTATATVEAGEVVEREITLDVDVPGGM